MTLFAVCCSYHFGMQTCTYVLACIHINYYTIILALKCRSDFVLCTLCQLSSTYVCTKRMKIYIKYEIIISKFEKV
jgi:hypothetical protein